MIPGQPKNPDWIVTDTDALVQLIITEHIPLLRRLKSDYGIQFLLVEAVESELLKILSHKFPAYLGAAKKAIHTQLLRVMDESMLAKEMGPAIAASLYSRMNQLGENFIKPLIVEKRIVTQRQLH